VAGSQAARVARQLPVGLRTAGASRWMAAVTREEASFLGRLTGPDAAAARRVYADWLLERGDPLGQYVATSIALAGAPAEERARLRTALRSSRARVPPERLAPLEQPATLLVNPTPLGARWWGTDLREARPVEGTYESWPYASLPPLPLGALGSFSGMPCSGDDALHADLDRAERLLRAEGLALPGSFRRYFGAGGAWRALRSCTACWYHFGHPVPAPGGEGTLFRFYSDQQSCVHWYLFLSREGDHCVAAGKEPFDEALDPLEEEEEGEEEPLDDASADALAARLLEAIHAPAGPPPPRAEPRPTPVSEAWFVAPSFEAFIVRCWLENELWFKLSAREPLGPDEAAYLAHYR